jgi:hypothetical protein
VCHYEAPSRTVDHPEALRNDRRDAIKILFTVRYMMR